MQVDVKYIDTTKYKVRIFQDDFYQDFEEFTDLFKVVQFRDRDFTNYGNLDEYCTENGKLLPSVQSKLRAGKMFTIDYRRYSSADGGKYYLDGSIPTGEVDSQDVNGFIIFNDEYIRGVSFEERKKYAREDLELYTQWANGEVYHVNIETANGDFVDSCGGFIGDDSVQGYIHEVIPDAIADNVDIKGVYYDSNKEYEVYFGY